MLYGGRLFAVNLVSPLGAGTPVTLEVAMELVYGRKSEKNGLFFSRTRPLFLGMEGGSISGAMFGVGGEALSNRFPTLFNLATNKEAKVADIWEIREGEGCWSPTFLRALNDWEIEEMTRFLHILHDQKFRSTGVDKLSLQNVKDRGFSVKSMHKGVDVSPPHPLRFSSPYSLESSCSPKNWSLCLGSCLGQSSYFGPTKTPWYVFCKQMFYV